MYFVPFLPELGMLVGVCEGWDGRKCILPRLSES